MNTLKIELMVEARNRTQSVQLRGIADILAGRDVEMAKEWKIKARPRRARRRRRRGKGT
jgi:hypothetical protein